MSVVYQAGNVGYGNFLVRVEGQDARPLPQFKHPDTHLPLPWEWRPSRYGRWMVAYAILLDLVGGHPALALRMADQLVTERGDKWDAKDWSLDGDVLREWATLIVGPF